MTAAVQNDHPLSLREQVAEEVRVAMARRRISGAELARRLGRSQTFVQKRLDGRQAFDVDDLEAVCAVLGLSPIELLAGLPFRSSAPQTAPRSEGVIVRNLSETRHLRLVPDVATNSTAHSGADVPTTDAA